MRKSVIEGGAVAAGLMTLCAGGTNKLVGMTELGETAVEVDIISVFNLLYPE